MDWNWIRNEWIQEDGQYVQTKSRLCMTNLRTQRKEIDTTIRAWSDSHDWVIGDDLIIGIPRTSSHYLVVFHKEVR